MNKLIITKNDQSDIYKCGVYKVYHIQAPDEIYIGSTSRSNGRKGLIGFATRFNGHITTLRTGGHPSKRLIELVNQYGIDGMRMAIIEVCEPEIARDREQYFIELLKPVLNQTKSAYNSLGYKHTPEAKEIMSRNGKGRVNSPIARQKISDALKGKMPKNVSMLWGKDAREKVAKKLRGLKRSQETIEKLGIPINQFTLHGEFIKSYRTMSIAARSVKIDRASINHCALGNRDSAGGFLWSFALTAPSLYENKSVVIQKSLSGNVVGVHCSVESAARRLGKTTTTAIRGAIKIKTRTAYGFVWEKIKYAEAVKHPLLAKELGLSESRLTK